MTPLLCEPQAQELDASFPIAIYNNGVPSLQLTSEQDVYDILHGIEDPLECFPPNAQDAAELEACEAFVETMAYLAMLEEQEERARTEFNHIEKRWEVRRQQGLAIGRKPKPAKHSIQATPHLVHSAVHSSNVQSMVKALPHYSHYNNNKTMEFAPLRVSGKMKHESMNVHAAQRSIQQPRKNC